MRIEPLTNEDRAQICELGRRRRTQRQIAATVGCSIHAVRSVLAVAGICRRMTPEQRARTIELLESGASYQAVAAEVGLTYAQVAYAASQAGHRRGPALKISDGQVRELRTRYVGGEDLRKLAANYGISREHAYDIVAGKHRAAAGGPIVVRAVQRTDGQLERAPAAQVSP
jgi:hypothetical protein